MYDYDYGTDPSYRSAEFRHTELDTGQVALTSDAITLKQGQGRLRRGTVLGRITETQKWVVSVAAANDGSEVPRRVLAYGADTTAGDVANAAGYKTGQFIFPALVLGAGHTMASLLAAWEDTGRDVVNAT